MHSRQQAADSRQQITRGAPPPPATPPSLRRSVASSLLRPAFTLTEILIVIGIIVIVLAMAVPAFNYMTGARSIEAAENTISAMLGRARAEALRTQQDRGLAFFTNPANNRLTMAMVGPVPATVDGIDLLEGRDWQPLQPGIAAAFVNQGADRYAARGVILFDGNGRLIARAYTPGPRLAVDPFNFPARTSQFGIMLYDRQVFQNVGGNNAADQFNWIDQNGHLLLINRYNGTLIRGE